MKLPFFTIGHSNRSIEEFIELLSGAKIDLVADIRTVPRSRANPQFNKDTLPGALAAFDISYEHLAALGGFRGRENALSQDVNDFWTNESFHSYADSALTAQFHAGVSRKVTTVHWLAPVPDRDKTVESFLCLNRNLGPSEIIAC